MVLYFLTIHSFVKTRGHKRKLDTFFIFFSTALLLLITIYIACQSVFGEEMWVVNTDYPGGDAAYSYENESVWYQILATAAFIILNLLCDGLMVS